MARKQDELNAGRKKFEAFKEQQAAVRARRSRNRRLTNTNEHNNQPVVHQQEIHTDLNGGSTSDGVSDAVVEPSQVVNDENRTTDYDEVVSSDTHPNPTYHSTVLTEIAQAPKENKVIDGFDGSWSRIGSTKFSSSSNDKNDDNSVSTGLLERHDYGSLHDQSVSQVTEEDDGTSYQSTYGQLNQTYSKATDSHLTDFTFASPSISNHVFSDVSYENSGDIQLPNNYSNGYLLDTGSTLSSNEDSVHSSTKVSALLPQGWRNGHDIVEPSNSSIPSLGERKLNEYFGNLPVGNSTTFWPKESQSTASTTGLSSSSYSPLYQAGAEINTKRSRSSFLDTINLSRVEPGKGESLSSKVHDIEALSSSTFEKSFTENEKFNIYSKPKALDGASAYDHSTMSLVSMENGNDMYKSATNNNMERDSFFNSRKHDDDFIALEQHIEDLMQEKYSLQRALEASSSLADSLAAENSSLTDSYNQQGSFVNQLKSDMEMLQEEIKAHLVELESVQLEYANAQLECTAADERVKLLASEVISLEEKVLRLRSSELKLKRQLENSQDEISSFRRKFSSLEKDRQDLQSTINALQEEKKLLQAKLRKTSASGKSIDAGKSLDYRKDVSTSTADLLTADGTDSAAGPSNLEMDNKAHLQRTDSSAFLLPEDGQFSLEFASSRIRSDQLRMVQNINTLISELALEKEELTRALLIESSESSKLKGLNKELSRKLEVQTQRLELLTAQSLANENIPFRQPDSRSMMTDNTQYADEGDEVVERVLNWIMKLFPGGPSRQRNSKLG